MDSLTISFKNLSDNLINSSDRYDAKNLVPYLKSHHHLTDEKIAIVLAEVRKSFLSCFKAKYKKCQNKKDRFLKETKFLGRKIVVNFKKTTAKTGKKGRPKKPVTFKINQSHLGRKRKSFDESSERTKRRKVNELRQKLPQELLLRAAKPILKSQKATKARYTPDEALALFIEAKLTKESYNVMKRGADSKLKKGKENPGPGLYPSYDYILAAKKDCYPENVSVTEKGASVDLQSLLNHTGERILKIKSAAGYFDDYEGGALNLIMLSKYGYDGATGQSIYKQKFSTDEDLDDSSIIMSCMVPLKLTQDDQVFWENNQPSSPNLCRPIKFFFGKETEELTTKIVSELDEEVNNLIPYKTVINDIEITITFKMEFTMVDGKVCKNASGAKSHQNCYICGAKPTEMNDINKVKTRKINEQTLRFGLSTLHAQIRFMELVLKISYNQDFRQWSTRTKNAGKKSTKSTSQNENSDNGEAKDTETNLEKKNKRKAHIQNELKKQIGILVDAPRAGGAGNSNDGNTARRFFGNIDVVSEVTGFNKDLLHRFKVILEVLCSGENIDGEKYDKYCEDTAILYIKYYNWYYMPSTIHKVLMHGKQIIEHHVVPIGTLSEEAQEHRNKHLKEYRRNHSRKTSRLDTNVDVFNRLLVTSDPFITSLRKGKDKTKTILSIEAQSLLRQDENL